MGEGPWPAGRLYFTYNITPKHSLRAMAAPLSYTETGVFEEPVRFAKADYQPALPTEATYQFDSWRVGYQTLQGGQHRTQDRISQAGSQQPGRAP